MCLSVNYENVFNCNKILPFYRMKYKIPVPHVTLLADYRQMKLCASLIQITTRIFQQQSITTFCPVHAARKTMR